MLLCLVMFLQNIFAILISFFPPYGMNVIGAVSWSAVIIKLNKKSGTVQYIIMRLLFIIIPDPSKIDLVDTGF